jgi:hypothetical protein
MMTKPRSIEELKAAVKVGTVRCGETDNVTNKRCRKRAVGVCICGAAYCQDHNTGMQTADHSMDECGGAE